MNTRVRVTAIPALLAAGALAALPGVLKSAAALQATPEAQAVDVAAWADLGLPEIELQFTSAEITGMPGSVEAGRYLVTIHGEPTQEDFAFAPLFLRVPDDMTLDDLMADAGEAADTPPEFFYEAVVAGGPSIVAGTGMTATFGVVDLPPGEWIVAGSALAQPPMPFTVTGDQPTDLPEPQTDVTLTIGEMVISISEGQFAVGENLVKIENIGAQPHFVDISKVPDGTTQENVEATIAGFMGATPEAEPVAEEELRTVAMSSDQSGGTVMWMALTIQESGTHVATCWIPDPESGVPHAALGMVTVFEVA